MVARKHFREEMTTNNLNQLMRTRLNLNSQVLSKNTNEMVSTCVAKLYKQVPNKFRSGLQQIKIAAARIENRAPLRVWKCQEQQQLQSSKIPKVGAREIPATTFNNDEIDLLNTVMKASRKSYNSHVGANKRLLKSPNYKIYSNRRYGSSASSSNGSLFRRMDEGRHSKRLHSVQAVSHLKKSYTMIHGPKNKPQFALHSNATSIAVPARNQHMRSTLGSATKASEVNSSIQKDLMVINDILRERMRVSAQKVQLAREPSRWDNPPSPQLFKSRNEQIFAHTELQQQCKRLQTITDTKPRGGTYRQMEKVSRTNPALSSEIIRKRFAHLCSTKKKESQKLNPIYIDNALSSLQYFASRKPLTAMETSNMPAEEVQHKPSFSGAEENCKYKYKPYKVNGRIASPATGSLASVAALGTTRRYNRINYLKLSSSFKAVQQQ